MAPRMLALDVHHPPFFADHRADGRPVLPAVEALALLAGACRQAYPGIEVQNSRAAEFRRFLPLPEAGVGVEAGAELTEEGAGKVRARLVTRGAAGKAGIARVFEHVAVTFGGVADFAQLPMDRACVPEGVGLSFPAKRLYSDLVPFGPAFHHLVDTVHLTRQGAVGRIKVGDFGTELLGSPLALDAAFHLACAWGQRFEGELTFPVGFARRHIVTPCRPGGEFFCRVVPEAGKRLAFDLWIYDLEGNLCEVALGVRMADVFRGRFLPPAWVMDMREDPLAALRRAGPALAVVELDSLPPFVERAFCARERERFKSLGSRRRRSFSGARIALKLLARQLGAGDVPAGSLDTLAGNPVLPVCPAPQQAGYRHAAAAHDDRFAVAVAVAAPHPIGVDVERIGGQVLRAQRLFINEREKGLVQASSLGEQRAALRIWSFKECAAKALNVTLAKAFARVEVRSIGEERCTALVDGEERVASCAVADDHLFTVLEL